MLEFDAVLVALISFLMSLYKMASVSFDFIQKKPLLGCADTHQTVMRIAANHSNDGVGHLWVCQPNNVLAIPTLMFCFDS